MTATSQRAWLKKAPQLAIIARKLRRLYQKSLYADLRKVNIAMFHAGRCGSTATSHLLRQHPDFHWGGEIFESMSPEYYGLPDSQRARTRVADSMYLKRCIYYGFETKYLPEQHLRPELASMKPGPYLHMLRELGFRHFILLKRRNQLRQAVSTLIGYKTGQWTTTEAPSNSQKVYVDPDAFISYGKKMSLFEFFSSLDDGYAELRRLLSNDQVLELEYERDIEKDPTRAYRKVCQFVDAPDGPVQIRLRRQNPAPMRDLIENYSDIVDLLSTTKYAWMLEQEH